MESFKINQLFFCDNLSTIQMIKIPMEHKHTECIHVRFLYEWNKVEKKKLKLNTSTQEIKLLIFSQKEFQKILSINL